MRREDFTDEHLQQLPFLTETDQRIVHLYIHESLIQQEIADAMGMSQAGVSFRLNRIAETLAFRRNLPPTSEEDLREQLPKTLRNPNDVDVLVEFWKTLSQSEVAKRRGTSQGHVRYQIYRSAQRLQQANAPHAALFKMLTNRHQNFVRVERAK